MTVVTPISHYAHVGFGGSKSLPRTAHPTGLASNVIAALDPDVHIHVGCCVGVDEAIIQLCMSIDAEVSIYTSYGPQQEGASSTWSAVDTVQFAHVAGIHVTYWAGGHGGFRSRVVARTRLVASKPGPTGAFIGFFDRPATKSRGTLLACRTALSYDSTIYAFPRTGDTLLDLGPHTLATGKFLESGQWVTIADDGIWMHGYQWQPQQD